MFRNLICRFENNVCSIRKNIEPDSDERPNKDFIIEYNYCEELWYIL